MRGVLSAKCPAQRSAAALPGERVAQPGGAAAVQPAPTRAPPRAVQPLGCVAAYIDGHGFSVAAS
eukprot:3107264-Alexandrium_andersonii.AAC.1